MIGRRCTSLHVSMLASISTLLISCSTQPYNCSSGDAAEIVQDQMKETILALLQPLTQLSVLTGQGSGSPTVSVELSDYREYLAYNNETKTRFCEATATTSISGLGGIIEAGSLLNGLDPQAFAKGIQRSIRYQIQIIEDGTQLVSVQDGEGLE
jgi:hypothetical protein